MTTNQLRPPRLRGTFGWTAAVIAVIPAAVGVLWLVGAAVGKTGHVAHRVHVNWTQVSFGAATLSVLTLIATTVHTVRNIRYRRARYQQAAQELSQ